ncbi:MAG: NAD(P)-binding protein [Candidatus Micrarchaeaceae archaeon]
MASLPNIGPENITANLIIAVLATAIIMFVINFAVLFYISKNPFASSYFATTLLFDYGGIDEAQVFPVVPSFSLSFITLFVLGILDGFAKISFIGVAIASFISLISSIKIRERIYSKRILGLKGHSILCGYNRLTEETYKRLKGEKVIICENQDVTEELRDLGMEAISGAFTKKEVLERANAKNAKSILFLSENQLDNLLGLITARKIAPKSRIVVRLKDESLAGKSRRAGADVIIVPEASAANEAAEELYRVAK